MACICDQEGTVYMEKLKAAAKVNQKASATMLHLDMQLKELQNLNFETYINAQLNRVLNRTEVLSHDYIKQENENQLHFNHHTEKTKYVNDLLLKGGYIPLYLVLYKLNLTLVSVKDQTNTKNRVTNTITTEQLKGLRN